MHSVRKLVSATAVMRSMALACMALLPFAAAGQTKPTVTVVNPASNPVNTKITNAVVPVEISNANAIPVRAQESEGSRLIFARTITIDMNGGASSCNETDSVGIPFNKRMVVEYLSASTSFVSPTALVDVRLEGFDFPKPVIVVPAGKSAAGAGNVTYASAGQHVHAYSDVPLYACARTSDPNSEELQVHVLGYYVDKP